MERVHRRGLIDYRHRSFRGKSDGIGGLWVVERLAEQDVARLGPSDPGQPLQSTPSATTVTAGWG